MKWRQFFTPVKSYNADKAREFISKTPLSDMTILDVRQPKEYEVEHIPGAKLIPVADLGNRISELDPEKPTLVYCAIGGRSRVAAQMLSGRGFHGIINLAGGIRAWNGEKASFGEEKGLELFTGMESLEQTLIVAYSLELGLEEFYVSMTETAKNEAVKELFQKLSRIEVNHRDRIFQEYVRITNKTTSQEEFTSNLVVPAAEGGMSTEEYVEFFSPERESLEGIIEMAMSIEAQALDLYFRASERAEQKESQKFLSQMADEERTHLRQLGQLMDSIIEEGS
jgi:rhodanese-related sulfurtransferase/rubrerythrin